MTDDGRPGAEKGPDAFRTISEVADDLGVPQHVLRFWETRFPQIKPIKRGGNRRYYRPNDVDLLRGVKHLLYGEGYTIRGVQRILREQGQRRVAGYADGGAPAPDPQDLEPQEPRPQDVEQRDPDPQAFDPAGRHEPRFAPQADAPSDNAPTVAERTPFAPPPDRRDLSGPVGGPEMWAPQRRGPQAPIPSPGRPAPPHETLSHAAAPHEGRTSEFAPPDEPAPAAPIAGPTLSPEQTRRLRAALLELDACRRILEERL
ncbi:MerR family transcriptional regulator [Methylopila musalis]|uniref:MerR family transcriptional regulator n=1 Tax=Methylopila musalis TaxID=1134781 RepID=A0ABW3Z336_9HYPH